MLSLESQISTIKVSIVLTFIEFHAKSNISKGCMRFLTGLVKVNIRVNAISVPNDGGKQFKQLNIEFPN